MRLTEARASLVVFAVAAVAPISTLHAQASPRPAGAAAWLQCSACHSLKPGAPNKVGPNLYNIAGKAAGKVPGYNYSKPLKGAKIVWTDKMLDLWLKNPSAVVKGNKMVFPGIPDAKKRKAVIDYMKQQK